MELVLLEEYEWPAFKKFPRFGLIRKHRRCEAIVKQRELIDLRLFNMQETARREAERLRKIQEALERELERKRAMLERRDNQFEMARLRREQAIAARGERAALQSARADKVQAEQ